jgi:hypothetical protein
MPPCPAIGWDGISWTFCLGLTSNGGTPDLCCPQPVARITDLSHHTQPLFDFSDKNLFKAIMLSILKKTIEILLRYCNIFLGSC